MPASYSSHNPPHSYERDIVPEWPRRSRPPVQRNDPLTTTKRSTGRRMLRGIFRLVSAILIGVAGTLAWQSHGEEAKAMVRAWAPSLTWLVPAPTASTVDNGQVAATAMVTSADLAQQLKPVALDLAIVRHGVDQLATTIKQLAAKQEEMAQEIATLQATEQDLKEKVSASAQPRSATTRKTPQSTGQSPAVTNSGAPIRLLDNPAQSTR